MKLYNTYALIMQILVCGYGLQQTVATTWIDVFKNCEKKKKKKKKKKMSRAFQFYSAFFFHFRNKQIEY